MKKILFLCTGNSCRSQMAEGFCRFYHAQEFEAYSAGIKATSLNPYAVKVMKEEGIDISGFKSKTTEELPQSSFDFVFTLCDNAKDSCPFFPVKTKLIHVGFEDPPFLAQGLKEEEEILQIYRRVRDEIKNFIKNLQGYL